MTVYKIKEVRAYCESALKRVGLASDDAQIAADVLLTNEMRGTQSHGLIALNTYLKEIEAGGICAHAELGVVREGSAFALVNGNAGMGVVTSVKAMRLAMTKASSCGVGVVSVRNSMHFSAASYYPLMAARENMIGIAATNSDPTIPAEGGYLRMIGNNPFSVAIPTNNATPICLDIAISKSAGGKLSIAAREGKPIAEGLALDLSGNPTTDPNDFLAGGALLPIAGYKGYGLAVVIECLTSVLAGAAITTDLHNWTLEPDKHSDQGQFFLALDIRKFSDVEAFKARAGLLVERMKAGPMRAGVERIYLPGEIEQEKYAHALAHGLTLNAVTRASLRSIAKRLSLETEFIKTFGEE